MNIPFYPSLQLSAVHLIRHLRGCCVELPVHSGRTWICQSKLLCGVAALALLVLLVTGRSYADAPASMEGAPAVTVFVRAIEATEPRGEHEMGASQRIEPALSDLAPKLSQLAFTSFRLLTSKHAQLSLRKRESLTLPNGHTLAFRPVYLEQSRVALWLSWRDPTGIDILNTRIHFDADDAVLTGTDSTHNSGFLLAIKAVPVRP
jgi:hypothetical protein